MEPLYVEYRSNELELEYALVRYSRCELTFKYPDQFRQDEVDVTLIVNQDRDEERPDVLRLRYFLIFSRKEISPTSYDNNKQSGIFRTVLRRNSRVTITDESGFEATASGGGGYEAEDLSNMMQVTAANVNAGT